MDKNKITKKNLISWIKKTKNPEIADKMLELIEHHNRMVGVTDDVLKYWKDSRNTTYSLIKIGLWVKLAFIISTFALVYAIGVIL